MNANRELLWHNTAMSSSLATFQLQVDVLKQDAVIMLYVLSALLVIQFINSMTGYRLNSLGNHPRHITGVPGIVIGHFLHGDYAHLFANAFPLFILGTFALHGGVEQFIWLNIIIILMSGILLWIFGRNGLHVGASCVVMGYFSYLLMYAYQNPSILSLVLGAVTIYYFAALILGLFPSDVTTSWEGHVFGFISGISAVYLIPHFVS